MAAFLIVVLSALQGILALPWLYALEIIGGRDRNGNLRSSWMIETLVVVGIATALFSGMLYLAPSPVVARIFGFILQTQLVIAIAIVAPWVLGFFWPKGAAIAYAFAADGWRFDSLACVFGATLLHLW